MIRVLVCDDHEVVRDGIRLIASETDDVRVVDEAATGQEGLQKALANDYDVVLLDVSLPDRNGVDVLKALLAQKPQTRVLILSMHPEEQYALRILKAGAYGYLTKSSASTELAAAIRKVAGGKRYITSTVAERLSEAFGTGAEQEAHEQLSDREYQVMCLLAGGRTVKDIALEMVLSPNTVKTYRSRVMRKMGFKNNADLVRYAVENRLPY